MAKPKSEVSDEARERSRDLKELRRLAAERGRLERDSPEWLEITNQEAALSRKIHDWASRVDNDD